MAIANTDIVQASPVPVIVSGVAVLGSVGVYFLASSLHSEVMFVLGYLLTPFATTMALGWDAVLQRKGKANPWFNAKPNFARILQVLAIGGFVVGIAHIYQIGVWIGAQAVQNGWVK
jgi:hypothetical protein